MQPGEVSVLVLQAHGLISNKKKNKHKYVVSFGVGDQKAKSEPVDCDDGNPVWNTEAQLNVTNPFQTLSIKVKDKDDTLGCVTLEMHEIPSSRMFKQRKVPLRAHKHCPNPKGEITFEAWISKMTEATVEEPTKKGGLSKLKQIGGSKNDLANQKAKLGHVQNSSESLASTVSGQSALSSASKSKKSSFKKFKGVFGKSQKQPSTEPLSSSKSSMSCMDLSSSQSSTLKHLPPLPSHGGSRESLHSQSSNLSGHSSAEKKKTKNPFKKLKEKVSHSPYSGRKEFQLSKKSSQSMSDLAFGQAPLSVKEIHGSNESLEFKAQSSMGKGFPEKFDLTVPKTLIGMSPPKDEVEIPPSPPQPTVDRKDSLKVMGHKRTLSDTPSWNNSAENSPAPDRKKRLSFQKRNLQDVPMIGSNVEVVVGEDEDMGPPGLFVRDNHKRSSGFSTGSARSGGKEEPVFEEKAESEEIPHDTHPEISGVSPSQASCDGGTRLTIRGERLGNTKDDIIKLSICGTNCLSSLEYMSQYKIHCTTKATHPGTGKIIVETESGGRGVSMVDFVFLPSEKPPPVTGPPPKPPRQNKQDSPPLESKRNSVDLDKGKQNEMFPPSKKMQPESGTKGSGGRGENNRRGSAALADSQWENKTIEEQNVEQNSYNPFETPGDVPESPKLNKEKKKITPVLEDFVREDPEGMPTVKETSPDYHHKTMGDTEKLPAGSIGGESELLKLQKQIKQLQEENSALKDENLNLKDYINKITNRVLEECPDLLCIDTSRPRHTTPYRKASH